MNFNLLKSYITKKTLIQIFRNPFGVYPALRWIFTDYSEIAYSIGVPKSQFTSYLKATEFAKPVWSKARDFDKFLKQRGIIGGAGLMHPEIYALLYAIIRSLKPSIIVETGVASGMSSYYILKALKDNNKGELFSIDLPCELVNATPVSTPIPVGAKPGWLIPFELKDRWHLFLGRSSDVLPGLLKDLGQIDLFLHDSDHSYKNQKLEFEAVWPYLRSGGLLLSDDCSKAFWELSKKTKSKKFYFGKFGILIKRE